MSLHSARPALPLGGGGFIEDPPGGSTAASPFECVRSWKERAVGISGVLGVPGVSGVRGVPGAFVMKHFGRNGN